MVSVVSQLPEIVPAWFWNSTARTPVETASPRQAVTRPQ